jgi:ribokinase
MSKILTIGSVSQDVFFPTSDGVAIDTPEDLLSQKKMAFELGAKYHIEERFESLGGCSVNVGVGLAKLGEDVACYTTIGDDVTGEWILKGLKEAGIGTENVTVEKDCKSDLSAILVDKQSADRIIFSNQVANQRLKFDAKKIAIPDWLFVGDLNGIWQATIDAVLEISKAKHIALVFNPRQKTIHDDVKKIIETLHFCELLFVNKDEAIEIVSGCGEIAVRELLENEEYLVKVLRRLGAKTVALTDGERGAWCYDGNELLHAEAVKQAAVDSTGAGDAFTSGFLAAHIKRKDLATALQWGIANSSSSLKEYGGQKGLLFEDGIVAFAKTIKTRAVKS